MNKKPIELVNEFLMSAKSYKAACQANDKATEEKGYLFRCNETLQMCCRHPFQKECTHSSCFSNYSPCDGGRCIPENWVSDGWPDCLDGTDEDFLPSEKGLPEQLVCVQCAGVVLSAVIMH